VRYVPEVTSVKSLALSLVLGLGSGCGSATTTAHDPVSNKSATDLDGSARYTLRARFRDASGLPLGTEVMSAGIPIGSVAGLEIHDGRAVVRFEIRHGVKVRDTSILSKRATSRPGLYYLDLDPGDESTSTRILSPDDFVPHVVELSEPGNLLPRINNNPLPRSP
jgi:hypothetical protein